MVNILENLNKYVKEELDKESIPSDAKYAIIGTLNNNGTKIIATVNIFKTDKITTRVAALWEHDWDGDDTIQTKIIFTGK
jgi:hypothetical protein